MFGMWGGGQNGAQEPCQDKFDQTEVVLGWILRMDGSMRFMVVGLRSDYVKDAAEHTVEFSGDGLDLKYLCRKQHALIWDISWCEVEMCKISSTWRVPGRVEFNFGESTN